MKDLESVIAHYESAKAATNAFGVKDVWIDSMLYYLYQLRDKQNSDYEDDSFETFGY